jgi:hypothetical protein
MLIALHFQIDKNYRVLTLRFFGGIRLIASLVPKAICLGATLRERGFVACPVW